MVGLQSAQQTFKFRISQTFQARQKEHNQPECFWNAGIVTTYWTTLPESEPMKTEDLCRECKGTAKTVFIDGSSYKIGTSNYSGWGIWSPDEASFSDNGPLKDKNQSSDRAEVRALVAALEKQQKEKLTSLQTINMLETRLNIWNQEE
eukprot:11324236-Heterocapsa_arctica.AAC.1